MKLTDKKWNRQYKSPEAVAMDEENYILMKALKH